MLIEKKPDSLTDELKKLFVKDDLLVEFYKKRIKSLETELCTQKIFVRTKNKEVLKWEIISILLATLWAVTLFLWIFFA